MCTSGGGTRPVGGSRVNPMGSLLNPGKYIQNASGVPNNANTPEPTTAAQAAFQQRFGPYALGREFIIPTANVRSR
jgi:hypothetical protein